MHRVERNMRVKTGRLEPDATPPNHAILRHPQRRTRYDSYS